MKPLHTAKKCYVFVDCEAPPEKGAPSVADMTEFGAVEFESETSFYGHDCSAETFAEFERWLHAMANGRRLIFVSDNPAFDFQWINFYFWKYSGGNPFGHSARRIGDFFAGLKKNFDAQSDWKKWRVTRHDHNPVYDAMGNVEAFKRMLKEFE